jgi:hypothetical protein
MPDVTGDTLDVGSELIEREEDDQRNLVMSSGDS